jgi:alanine-synthesizing transaminase
VEFAKNTGLYLLHDFAHAEVYRDKADAPSLLSIPGAKDCSVEFYSLSKSFQMPGWRVGFAVGNEQLISGLRRVKSYLDFGVFQPLQLGTQAALDHGLVTVEEARLLYNDRRETLESGLNNLGWTVAPGRGSVFMWAKLPKTYQGEGAQKFSNLAVSKAGVAISPGSGFDLGADQFCRFALGETESRIREGLKRLEKLG